MIPDAEAPLPFGINTAQVQIFLEDLAEVDLDRAVEIWNGYSLARSKGYGDALYRAQAVAAKQRTDAWLRARDVASTITRERLGDADVTAGVESVVANVAGSLVVRDLLSRHDFRLLQLPWTRREDWSGRPLEPDDAISAVALPPLSVVLAEAAAAAAPAPVAAPAPAAVFAPAPEPAPVVVDRREPVRPSTRARSRRYLPRPLRFAIIATTVAAMAFVTRPSGSDNDLAGLPTFGTPSGLASEPPAPSEPATFGGGGSSLDPTPQVPSTSTSPTRGPTPRPTQQPPASPTPTPTQAPQPTPTPTPTAPPQCTVANLVGLQSTAAQVAWTHAGFTGIVTFSPKVPPKYVIAWQSLDVGQVVSCTSGITVRDHVP